MENLASGRRQYQNPHRTVLNYFAKKNVETDENNNKSGSVVPSPSSS